MYYKILTSPNPNEVEGVLCRENSNVGACTVYDINGNTMGVLLWSEIKSNDGKIWELIHSKYLAENIVYLLSNLS